MINAKINNVISKVMFILFIKIILFKKEDYKFIKVKTAKKATLKAIIRIIPIEAVEDFDISLTLEDSFSGIVTGISE